MKAPEKIYLWESELCGRDYDDEWFDCPLNGDSVEYTRTDVIMENVCEFLKTNASKHIYFDEGNTEWYDTEELIEDLRKYLKRE